MNSKDREILCSGQKCLNKIPYISCEKCGKYFCAKCYINTDYYRGNIFNSVCDITDFFDPDRGKYIDICGGCARKLKQN